ARAISCHRDRMQRLPHPTENDRTRARAGHVADALRTSIDDEDAAPAKAGWSLGLGRRRNEHRLRAMRTGRHMGTSRTIMPPMPWPAFRNLNDEDLKSIFAYLRSIPPVVNHMPQSLEPHEVETALR